MAANRGSDHTPLKRSETVASTRGTWRYELEVFSRQTVLVKVFMSGTKRLSGPVREGDEWDQSSLDTGSSVLLLASCMEVSGREACRDLLTIGPTGQLNVLYVVLIRTGKYDLDWWTEAAPPSPDRMAVIDASPGPSGPTPVEGDGIVVESIGSPGNLTKIGVAISDHCTEFEGDGTTVVCLRSVTALLHYVDLDTAYRFLNAFVHQLASVGAIGHCHLQPDAHSPQQINTLRTLFDATITLD